MPGAPCILILQRSGLRPFQQRRRRHLAEIHAPFPGAFRGDEGFGYILRRVYHLPGLLRRGKEAARQMRLGRDIKIEYSYYLVSAYHTALSKMQIHFLYLSARLYPALFDEQHPSARAAGYALILTAGYKRLPAADAVQYKFLTAAVKLGQHIVQQQYGILPRFGKEYLPLRQLQRQRRRARLPL